MRINTDIDLRNRSKVTLSDFKGLDTLSTEVEVSAIHASNMKNLISRDGINHKRYGWSTQYRLRNNSAFPAIKGIFNFTIFAIQFLVVYSDKRFWLVNRSTSEFINITNKRIDTNGLVTNDNTSISPVQVEELEDSECKLFLNGDKAYFVGCGDLLVFSKWENGYFELRRVVGNEDVYIPTTTENIGCEEDGKKYTRITAEEKNLLSPYIKNTLFGKSSLSSGENATYFLDTKNFSDIEVYIKNKAGDLITLRKNSNPGNYAVGGTIKSTTATFQEIEIERTITGQVISNTVTLGEKVTGLIYTSGSVNVYLKTRGATWGSYLAREFGIDSDILSAGQVVKRNGIYAKVLNNRDSWNNSIMFGFNSLSDFNKFTSDMSVTGSSKSVEYGTGSFQTQTQTTYRADLSIGLENQIDLITMSNGGVLAFKNTILNNSTTYYGNVDGVDIYYTAPSRYSTKLVYIKNSEVVVLGEVSSITLNIDIDNNITATRESCSITATSKYNYPNMSFDLSNYSATIETIHLGTYIDKHSFQLVDDATPTKYSGSVSFENGVVSFNYVEGEEDAYAPLTDSKPNIEVILKIENDASQIVKAKLGVKFGTYGSPDRLFVVSPNGNIIHWSKDEDFTYFGEKSWCVCGTADKKITGMDRLNDTTLLIVKEFSAQEPSVYVINGAIYTGKTEANTVDYTAVFTPSGFQVGMGAVGSITNFNGDCLMVAKDGVYAVSLGENMTVDSRYILHRSKQISNLLERYDLSASKCIAFNGKYYIYVGGEQHECFVADNKYKTLFNHDESQVNYEWWRWEHIPVSVWGFVDDELWFGTQDGQLCKFTNKFYDEEKTLLESGIATYGVESGYIEFLAVNNSINFTSNDKIKIECDLYRQIKIDKFFIENGRTYFELPLNKFTNGETIKILENGNYVDYVLQFDDNGLTCSIEYIATDDVVYIFKNVNGMEFNVRKSIQNNHNLLYFVDESGNQFGFVSNLSSSISNFRAYLIHREAVVAEWWTGALDLGNRAYQKTLTYFVLTGEKNLANHLKYGFKTRFNHTDFELLRANNDLEMEETDLQTVSLDSEFGSSFTKRLNIRNVNFVMLYFRVETEEDLAINSVQIEFKLIKRNIGVR